MMILTCKICGNKYNYRNGMTFSWIDTGEMFKYPDAFSSKGIEPKECCDECRYTPKAHQYLKLKQNKNNKISTKFLKSDIAGYKEFKRDDLLKLNPRTKEKV